jgi:DNA-binding XRE family transcriptional regulator
MKTARRTRLVEARRARGMTQRELATAAGIYISTIKRIESGELDPSVSNALAIAKPLRRTVEFLFAEEDHPMTAGEKAAETKLLQREAMSPGQKAAQTKQRKAAARKARQTRQARAGAS